MTKRIRETKKDQDLTFAFVVDQPPQNAFAAINNVRGWWSGEIEGPTDKLGGEFTYRYKDIHYSKHKITELIPGKKVVWLVLDSSLDFIEDKTEWNGTKIAFDIAKKGTKPKSASRTWAWLLTTNVMTVAQTHGTPTSTAVCVT